MRDCFPASRCTCGFLDISAGSRSLSQTGHATLVFLIRLIFENRGNAASIGLVLARNAAEVLAMGLLLALLIVLLIFSVPAWPYSSGWGYYPSGGLGLLLLILLILMLVRRPA